MGVYFFLPSLHFPNTGTVGGLRLVDALEFSLGNATCNPHPHSMVWVFVGRGCGFLKPTGSQTRAGL